MKTLDFTPQWYRESKSEHTKSRMRSAGMCVAAVLAVVWWVNSVAITRAAQQKLSVLAQSSDAQMAMTQRLNELDLELVELRSRAELLSDAGGGIRAGQILTELTHLMPEQMTLQKVRYQRAPRIKPADVEDTGSIAELDIPTVSSLELTGWAASGTDTGVLVSRLARSEFFENATLLHETAVTMSGIRMVEFQIRCTVPEFQ